MSTKEDLVIGYTRCQTKKISLLLEAAKDERDGSWTDERRGCHSKMQIAAERTTMPNVRC